jgi:putative transposase
MSMQEFFTTRELAELAARLGYQGMMHNERGVRRHADREGWNELPADLCRRRKGRGGGGGLEYHISLVPRLEILLAAERLLQADTTASRAVTVLNSVDQKQPAATWQRDVADARGQILTAVIAFASRTGKKISQAIADFLEAQNGHEAWLLACRARDLGELLTLSDKLKLQEGSPMEALPAVENGQRKLTADHKYPFGFGIAAAVLATANNRPRKDDEFQKVGRSTLYAWLKAYQEGGVGALMPDATKLAEPIPQDFWRFMGYFARPAKPRLSEIYDTYLADAPEGIRPLTANQVEYILREKLDHIQRNKGREGRLALRARMAFVSRDTSDILPGTIYVGDGHTFDARIADPVSQAAMRPEITAIIDVATRRCVGWSIARKENVIAVTEALRNACTDHGIPAVVYFDRGAGYKNKRFDDEGNGLMSRLDITKMHALPYGSQAKGNIERSHRSIWIPFARKLPTYLGEDMDKEARLKIDKQIKADRKEFGYSRLLMPWEEFRQECQRRVDDYNDRPHSELPRFADPATGRIRHMSPDEYWQSHVDRGFEPVPVDPFTIDDLFRPYEKRTVSRCLVELWTNQYFSLDLNPYHKQEVLVGYDDNQADRVWIREIDRTTNGPGKLICVAAYGGNKVSYMPKTFLEGAMERREKGRLKRNEARRIDIEAERRAPLVLDYQPAEPAEFIDLTPSQPVPDLLSEPRDLPGAETVSRIAAITTDADLAKLCLADPGQLTEGRARILREAMSRRNARELLRISGVDLDELDDLLRSAA